MSSRVLFLTLGCLLALAATAWADPYPYTQGHSIGPEASIPNPTLDADELEFAEAYWQYVDSEGADNSLFLEFDPQSPKWDPNSGGGPYVEVDPFVVGYALFREIYEHRLQLDPSQGPIVDIRSLIASETDVASAWRHWTLTHQLLTHASDDPIAHENHISAIQEALASGEEWWTRGVPYFSGSTLALSLIVVSDRTEKKVTGTPEIPEPEDVSELGDCMILIQQRIEDDADVLVPYAEDLYDEDGGWWFGLGHVGFDCDDFADALASYLTKDGCPTGCLKGVTLRVTWSTSGGSKAAHLVTKIVCCDGAYWLVDGQTGAYSGPYSSDTPADARSILGGYDVDNTRPVTTEQEEREIGDRPSLGEPAAWYEDEDQVERFENITGMDASDFHP